MKVLYFVVLCVCLCAGADGSSAPFITPCHAADSACLKSSAQKAVAVLAAGVPELGILPMDPMSVKQVVASEAGLEMNFQNTTVKGLRHCTVEKLQRKNMTTYLELKCSVVLVGNYTLDGKLIVFPIEGSGRYKIQIRDILVKIEFHVVERTVTGLQYWHVGSWSHTAEVLTRAHFQFDNLFHGNKHLSDTVHEFANRSWQLIFKEVAPPIVKAIVSTIVNEIQKLFDNVPVKELAL